MTFGCGKFEEIRMLAFAEGSPSAEIEKHLMECGDCLAIMIDLNRISSLSEAFRPAAFLKPSFITLFSATDGFQKMVTNLLGAKLELLPETRAALRKETSFIGMMPDHSIEIQVLPSEERLFWVRLRGVKKEIGKVELTRKGENLPYIKLTSSEKEVYLKDIPAGEYVLKIEKDFLRLKIENTRVN